MEAIVPVAARLRTEAARDLGLDAVILYDNGIIFPAGDPKPMGGKDDILTAARDMYHEMSEETSRFIDMMLEHEALDVDARIPSPFQSGSLQTPAAGVEQLLHQIKRSIS